MKEFILGGDTVKRLLYNRPINDVDYEYYFTNWILNSEQPVEGISIVDNKIIISKIKPNVWFIKSNYNLQDRTSYLDKFYNKQWILKNFASSSELQRVNTGTYHPIGLVILPINPNNNSFISPASCNVSNGSFKAPNAGWASYGYKVDGTRALYNYSVYNATYSEVGLGIYTSVTTDEDGCVEFETPLEISVPNIANVDPTTQEVFKLYLKDELIYERDRTFENLYIPFGLNKETTQSAKSDWQANQEQNGKVFSGNIAYKFTREDYNYSKVNIPVSIDLVQMIQNFVPLKFEIEQYDTGRNEFWKTVIQTINNINSITDYLFPNKLFRNAKGLANLDWNAIGDSTSHGLVLNLGPASQYFWLDECFAWCDIPTVTINQVGGVVKSIHDTFKYSKVVHIKFGQNVVLQDIIGAFEGTSLLESVEGLTVVNVMQKTNGGYLSEATIAIHYSFEATHLETLNIDGEDLIVFPYCPQVFGSNCKLKTITGSAFDFKFVNPNELNTWGVPGSYGHPIFGNSILESIKIKNLNKGNWTIPMPLNNTSVKYLLNNIFDLTTNSNPNLEKDSNSFNGWSTSNASIYSAKSVAFAKGGNASISKSGYTGDKILKFKASVALELNFTLYYNNAVVLSQGYTIGTSETIIDLSAYNFDKINIGRNFANYQNDVVLTITNPFDSAASTTTSATLTLSNVIYDSDFDSAIAVAQARGWTIQFSS